MHTHTCIYIYIYINGCESKPFGIEQVLADIPFNNPFNTLLNRRVLIVQYPWFNTIVQYPCSSSLFNKYLVSNLDTFWILPPHTQTASTHTQTYTRTIDKNRHCKFWCECIGRAKDTNITPVVRGSEIGTHPVESGNSCHSPDFETVWKIVRHAGSRLGRSPFTSTYCKQNKEGW